jgi:hypothetical protein
MNYQCHKTGSPKGVTKFKGIPRQKPIQFALVDSLEVLNKHFESLEERKEWVLRKRRIESNPYID